LWLIARENPLASIANIHSPPSTLLERKLI
jgi:hypothetical protein